MNKIVSNVIYFSVFCQKNVVFQRNSVYENKFSVRYGSTKNVCRLFSTWNVNAKTKSFGGSKRNFYINKSYSRKKYWVRNVVGNDFEKYSTPGNLSYF